VPLPANALTTGSFLSLRARLGGLAGRAGGLEEAAGAGVDRGVEGLDVTGVEGGDAVEGADVADVDAGGGLEEAVGAGDGGDGDDPTTKGMPGLRLAGSCTLPPEAENVSE
jgi:hypothetical protein